LPSRVSAQFLLHGMLQSGEVDLDHPPNEVEFEFEVGMRDSVAEVSDVAPGNLQMAIPEVSGESAGRLGQRFESI
jgi:hypothetical protein